MRKLLLTIMAFMLTTACMQSRKGIKGENEEWVWGAVDMCDAYPRCDDESETWLQGAIHYDSNMMVFEVKKMPNDLAFVELASDETISYRILAKRQGEGGWRRMNWLSTYENSKIGLTENMQLSVGDIVHVGPPKGYIEQYNEWVLERVITKAGKSQALGAGERLLDIRVTYAELSQ